MEKKENNDVTKLLAELAKSVEVAHSRFEAATSGSGAVSRDMATRDSLINEANTAILTTQQALMITAKRLAHLATTVDAETTIKTAEEKVRQARSLFAAAAVAGVLCFGSCIYLLWQQSVVRRELGKVAAETDLRGRTYVLRIPPQTRLALMPNRELKSIAYPASKLIVSPTGAISTTGTDNPEEELSWVIEEYIPKK